MALVDADGSRAPEPPGFKSHARPDAHFACYDIDEGGRNVEGALQLVLQGIDPARPC
jgi:hypothetical protein